MTRVFMRGDEPVRFRGNQPTSASSKACGHATQAAPNVWKIVSRDSLQWYQDTYHRQNRLKNTTKPTKTVCARVCSSNLKLFPPHPAVLGQRPEWREHTLDIQPFLWFMPLAHENKCDDWWSTRNLRGLTMEIILLPYATASMWIWLNFGME